MTDSGFDRLHRINEVCEDFEQAWLRGERPDLGTYLDRLPESSRSELLSFLLELDLDYRQQAGEHPSRDEYLTRFPEFDSVIQSVFAEYSELHTAGKSSPDTVNEQDKTKLQVRLLCPRCKSALPRNSNFCPSCGTPYSPGLSGSENAPALSGSTPMAGQPLSHHGQFLPGLTLGGRYRIVGRLGVGGMGEVYRADDLRLGHTVALKFLPEELSSDEIRHAYFLNEIRLSRVISHPHVCRVYDLCEIEGQPVMSMEYIDGEDLKGLLKRIGKLPIEKAREIGWQIASGLGAAHENGILHRDMKPANIMIDSRGRAKITDFGLAKVSGEQRESEGMIGTPGYMAPEQFTRHETTVQSDLYTLGLILFEIFTGKKVFQASSLAELAQLREHMKIPPISQLVPELDDQTAAVIDQCLADDPTHRPLSASHIAATIAHTDPLATVMMSGETPSPEMLAGVEDSHAPKFPAILVFVVSMVLLVGVAILSTLFLKKLNLEKPPEVLVEKASIYVAEAHPSETPTYAAWGIATNRKYLDDLARNDERWYESKSNRPPATYFWYRASDNRLVPRKPDWTGDSFLRTEENRPPLSEPGVQNLRLNGQGQLLSYLASVRYFETLDNTEEATDSQSQTIGRSLLEQTPYLAAGVSPTLEREQSSLGDAANRSTRQVWIVEQTEEEAHTVRRVRTESGGGRFALLIPHEIPIWSNLDATMANMTGSHPLRSWMQLFWVIGLTLASGLLAHHNLRQGRAHRVGANRMALFAFSTVLISWVLRDTHVASQAELDLFFTALAGACLGSAFFWMTYIALEPHVRKTWPTTLLSWSRLVTGRVSDPMIGRDLLIGVLAGVSAAFLKWTLVMLPVGLNLPGNAYPRVTNFSPLLSMRVALGEMVVTLCLAVLYAFFFQLLFLLLLRLSLKKTHLVAIVFVLFMSIMVSVQFRPFWLALLVTALEMSFTVFLFLRFGVLAAVVMHFVRLMLKWPTSLDFSMWNADTGMVALLTVIGLACWGLWLSRSKKDVGTGVVS